MFARNSHEQMQIQTPTEKIFSTSLMPCTLLDYGDSQVLEGVIFEDGYDKFVSFTCVHVGFRNEQMCYLLVCSSL